MEPKGTSLGGSLLVPSVKELTKELLVDVPPRYVQSGQDPPVIPRVSSTLPEVPIIDIQRLLTEESIDDELEKLHLACKDWGFFQMVNHGVSYSLLEKVSEETQAFFKLPMEEKKKFWQVPGDLEGYGQAFVMSEDQKLDWADMFYMVTLPQHIRKPHLFTNLPIEFKDTIEEYSREVMNVAVKTLIFIAKALKMEVEEMKVLFDEGMQSMRLNYYPPCPQPEKVIGFSPHSDPLGITFLLQVNDVEGLQIKKDGIWMPIKPLANAFIVNLGDIVEIVTNGVYKSIEHRVTVNTEMERLSISTFVGPNMDGDFGPAPSLISPEKPPKFTRVNFVDFFKNFFARKLDGKSNIEQYYM